MEDEQDMDRDSTNCDVSVKNGMHLDGVQDERVEDESSGTINEQVSVQQVQGRMGEEQQQQLQQQQEQEQLQQQQEQQQLQQQQEQQQLQQQQQQQLLHQQEQQQLQQQQQQEQLLHQQEQQQLLHQQEQQQLLHQQEQQQLQHQQEQQQLQQEQEQRQQEQQQLQPEPQQQLQQQQEQHQQQLEQLEQNQPLFENQRRMQQLKQQQHREDDQMSQDNEQHNHQQQQQYSPHVHEEEQSYSLLFSDIPKLVGHAYKEFSQTQDNFLRGCKWAPDGSCILVCSNDNKLKVFNLPQEFLGGEAPQNESGEKNREMSSELTVQEGELIYDFAWFPVMNSMDPDSCCFASACRDHPVHLWDAYTGVIRATYTPYNHLDEVTSPNSLSFNVDGSQLYCGFSNCLRIFDITRPGRQVEDRETFKKNSPLGLQGIVSCIAFNPQYPEVYALGTYSKSIGLYSETSFGPMSIFSGVGGGVTHVMFSGDGNYLFSGGRKDPEVVCWDLRNPGKILYYLNRMVDTNQRMYFDLDITNRYLMSGHQNGAVSIWDIQNLPGDRDNDDSLLQLEPVFSFLAHNDCVNSISHHPTLPILASGSGQRKFSLPCLCTMSDGSDSDESGTSEEDTHENSLKLWHFIPHSTNHLSFSSGSSDLF